METENIRTWEYEPKKTVIHDNLFFNADEVHARHEKFQEEIDEEYAKYKGNLRYQEELNKVKDDVSNLKLREPSEIIDKYCDIFDLMIKSGVYYVDEDEPVVIGVNSLGDEVYLTTANIYDIAYKYFMENDETELYRVDEVIVDVKEIAKQDVVSLVETELISRRKHLAETLSGYYGELEPVNMLPLRDLLNVTYIIRIPKYALDGEIESMGGMTSFDVIGGVRRDTSYRLVTVTRRLGNIIELSKMGIDIRLDDRRKLLPLIADLTYAIKTYANLSAYDKVYNGEALDTELEDSIMDFYEELISLHKITYDLATGKATKVREVKKKKVVVDVEALIEEYSDPLHQSPTNKYRQKKVNNRLSLLSYDAYGGR